LKSKPVNLLGESVALGGALREGGVCFVNALGKLGSLTPDHGEFALQFPSKVG
jgi:hypothetical protein